ncbi:MAG: DNA-3-methyladenine glycosylase 2 family protein [Verrucomicrobia bacterium]|nr:DNA-3-methyladenine glycosylase 2 family protein [Verrucomicrobiota bacterium]
MSSSAPHLDPSSTQSAANFTGLSQIRLPVWNYDLAETLISGQAFRWKLSEARTDSEPCPRPSNRSPVGRIRPGEPFDALGIRPSRLAGDRLALPSGPWEGVIDRHWVRLSATEHAILAETAQPASSVSWIENYLQSRVDLETILATFPDDEPMRAAVKACFGLRILRQDPWECLASFILSSTKQIIQIRQIVSLLCERFGEPVAVPPGHSPAHSFPSAQRLCACPEAELRACKMGFRAAYLKGAADMVASSAIDLSKLSAREIGEARESLLRLPGVGRKIADCVLLFAYGFPKAFPIDVWVMKALRKLYFRGRQIPLRRLQRFSEEHFGPFGGYAQQYLFHYMRRRKRGSL